METTKRGGIPLYLWMLLGFAVGMGGGLYVNLMGLEVLPWVMDIIKSVGQIFLRLLFMLVLPLLFAALITGVAEMGDVKALGRRSAQDPAVHGPDLQHRGRHRPGHGQLFPARRRGRSGSGPATAGAGRRGGLGHRRQCAEHRRPASSSST
jgi:hypothetical protein